MARRDSIQTYRSESKGLTVLGRRHDHHNGNNGERAVQFEDVHCALCGVIDQIDVF